MWLHSSPSSTPAPWTCTWAWEPRTCWFTLGFRSTNCQFPIVCLHFPLQHLTCHAWSLVPLSVLGAKCGTWGSKRPSDRHARSMVLAKVRLSVCTACKLLPYCRSSLLGCLILRIIARKPLNFSCLGAREHPTGGESPARPSATTWRRTAPTGLATFAETGALLGQETFCKPRQVEVIIESTFSVALGMFVPRSSRASTNRP